MSDPAEVALDQLREVLCFKKLLDLLEQAETERDRLREALEWYAARRSGEAAWPSNSRQSVIDLDGGERARKALEESKP